MLDDNILALIAIESRTCFLEEDAPEFLGILKQGIPQLQSVFQQEGENDRLLAVYQELGRAAHSIKGGAAMAGMSLITQLAHPMEDLFEALQHNRIIEIETAIELLSHSTQELESLIEDENNNLTHDSKIKEENELKVEELVTVLQEFLASAQPDNQTAEIGLPDHDFIKTALRDDLSDCINRVQEFIDNQDLATDKNLRESLHILLEECQLLGQALSCDWLVEISQIVKDLEVDNSLPLIDFVQLSIQEINKQKELFLSSDSDFNLELSSDFKKLLKPTKVEVLTQTQQVKPTIIQAKTKTKTNDRKLRVPLDKINNMGDSVGQLLIFYEQLSLYEKQMKLASTNLKKRTKSLSPLKEELQSFYDQLTINEKLNISSSSNQLAKTTAVLIPEKTAEFDSLEFDRYNNTHTTLQSLTELIVQVEEVREDFDLVNRDFQETLIDMRKSLDNLDKDLRQVRLIPFNNLASSFIKPLAKLNQTYQKPVELIIEGKDTLVDQNIIEALRTPLNHLIRNAFDHGIESPEIRQQSGKSLLAQITLTAKIEGNNVVISIIDDGKGIDIDKVATKAKSLGLLDSQSNSSANREEILETIFSPGFSTANQVTELSGRGVGMDVVKAEIEKLRGTIQIDTAQGKGSQFQLKIPMTLNIISLLLVKMGTQIVAIPSADVKRIIRLNDYQKNENQQLSFEDELIQFYPLDCILPYQNDRQDQFSQPYVGLLINVANKKIIVGVDAVVDEKPLVTKSLDDTVATPPYLAGCTILGDGKVVPIFIPDYFNSLLVKSNSQADNNHQDNQPKVIKTENISIMVIDDSVALRRILTRVLTQIGYQVTQCRDGKEAWNTLQNTNQNFDLAICDLEMPGFDGYKVLQLIRVSDKWANLPVIILTSRDNDLHRRKAFDLGANDYLTKPFNPLAIVEKVASFFA